jgi:hypothetical protein
MWFINFFFVIGVSGWVNGFVTSSSMKAFGIADMIRGSTFSAFIYPAIILCCCIAIDVIEAFDKSSSALPLVTVLCYGVIFMTISVVCCYHGSIIGYTTHDPKSAIRVNPVKRSIPDMPWFLKRRVVMPVVGAIIFSSIFFEFTYIWDSIWGNRLYAMFGSLLLVVALLVFVVAEISIVHTYLLLQYENY